MNIIHELENLQRDGLADTETGISLSKQLLSDFTNSIHHLSDLDKDIESLHHRYMTPQTTSTAYHLLIPRNKMTAWSRCFDFDIDPFIGHALRAIPQFEAYIIVLLCLARNIQGQEVVLDPSSPESSSSRAIRSRARSGEWYGGYLMQYIKVVGGAFGTTIAGSAGLRNSWELRQRVRCGMMRPLQVQLVNLWLERMWVAFRAFLEHVGANFKQLDGGATVVDLKEDGKWVEHLKKGVFLDAYGGEKGLDVELEAMNYPYITSVGMARVRRAIDDRFRPMLRFLVKLRSESIEARIWKHLQEE